MKFKNLIIKSLSLGIGLAAGIVLIAKVCFEMSHDRCYDDAEQIYSIRTYYTTQDESGEYGQVSGAIAPGFKQYIPGVESATRTTFIVNSDLFKDEYKNIIRGSIILADSCFFDVFNTDIISGNPKEVLGQVGMAMVSESFAQKLGGTSEAIGKQIINEELPYFPISIGGVFKDFPYHSSVKHDILLSMESINKASTENWVGNDRYKGYVRLHKGINPDMLAPAIREMQQKNQNLDEIRKRGTDIHYFLKNITELYISGNNVKNSLIVLGITAVLLIVISLLNYILMSVSTMVSRAKEMGVRKCYGAERKNIYGIMAKEAAVDVLSATLVALALIFSFRSVLEDIIGISAEALLIWPTFVSSAIVLVAIFSIAAIVPGYLYSKIPVNSAFRNFSENKRIWKLSLLFLQVAICSLLLSLMFVIGTQYNKAVNDKPGYNYENLLWTVLTGTDKSRHQSIIDELLNLPDVTDVEMSYSLPLEPSSGNNIFMNEGPDAGQTLFNIADQYEGSEGLFELLEIPFIEGRYPQTESEVAVSESFLREMAKFEDWSDGAVGKRIWVTGHDARNPEGLIICGVYKDYRINTLTNQDTRASIKFLGKTGRDSMPFMAIKVNSVNSETIGKVRQVIQDRLPEKEIEVKSYKDSMREAYSDERRMKNTILAGCFISIIIALFGLMGYVRDESQRRSKEMAIRKINGASTKEIVLVYIVQILMLSSTAILLGNVAAYFAASIWLENFSEKVSISPLFFILADTLILILTVTTVIANSLKIARSNPVISLKND